LKKRRPPGDDGLYVVGVTGGVASGKSTFVAILAEDGNARVLDADRLGHAILRRADVVKALTTAFGDDIVDATGTIRRDILGPRAFESEATLQQLNTIVHPPLVDEIDRILEAYTRTEFKGLVILDAALLVEWDGGDRCDEVVAVIAKPEVQVQRLVKDRGQDEDLARTVVARQLPAEVRAAYADTVLTNDGTREDFVARARELSRAIHERATQRGRGS